MREERAKHLHRLLNTRRWQCYQPMQAKRLERIKESQALIADYTGLLPQLSHKMPPPSHKPYFVPLGGGQLKSDYELVKAEIGLLRHVVSLQQEGLESDWQYTGRLDYRHADTEEYDPEYDAEDD